MTTTKKQNPKLRDINKDFEAVIELVESVTGISRQKILGRTRPDDVCEARMLAYWLMREMDHTLGKIGGMLNRDHGSVLNGCRQIEAWAELDDRFRVKLERMRQRVENNQVEIKPNWKCPECGYTEGGA